MPRQLELDLFSEVLHAYSGPRCGAITNTDLYQTVASRCSIPDAALRERVPVGVAGQPCNPLSRKIRWYQQTLKHSGIIERVPGERGVWQLTTPASKDLSQIQTGVAVLGFSTDLGIAILGSAENVFSCIDAPIVLCVTSPPYPLAKSRQYGNVSESVYVDWLCKTLEPLVKNLANGGSICLNISNDIFEKGLPSRSLYRYRLVLALHERLGLHLMDDLVWHNPSKPPGPVQWASNNRFQLNAGYEPVLWMTNNPQSVKSNNQRVLQEHTETHLKLIQAGGEKREVSYCDGAYVLKNGSYSNPTAGKIPKNVLSIGHTCADQRRYKRAAQAAGLPSHGAPMPLKLAEFLVNFLSEPDDLVVDGFAGSFTTAKAAENLGRRWIATDIMAEYVMGGASRFEQAQGFVRHI
ncbi:site-specific DNA-methyltransferase [Ferrovum sp.]|uniref:site-specific DNA-methyltransferase n=1 Tax=Ferrovum sp. TaxID=2609467 RepID=UPI0026206BCE|nr:site-specific DNA-methyltransferase [Ferrovum sp.]